MCLYISSPLCLSAVYGLCVVYPLEESRPCGAEQRSIHSTYKSSCQFLFLSLLLLLPLSLICEQRLFQMEQDHLTGFEHFLSWVGGCWFASFVPLLCVLICLLLSVVCVFLAAKGAACSLRISEGDRRDGVRCLEQSLTYIHTHTHYPIACFCCSSYYPDFPVCNKNNLCSLGILTHTCTNTILSLALRLNYSSITPLSGGAVFLISVLG